ncbi:hypothetical protein BGX38DRAFT_1195621 [Terfezia claveryi]|nr:hypothetical protein BGX38DRAFT_1195621 [Terfezia claveryi]
MLLDAVICTGFIVGPIPLRTDQMNCESTHVQYIDQALNDRALHTRSNNDYLVSIVDLQQLMGR